MGREGGSETRPYGSHRYEYRSSNLLLDDGFAPRKNNPGGCPSCGGPEGTLRFNWRMAEEDPTNEFAPYLKTLFEGRPLKSGHLFKCQVCGQKWWLDPPRETLSLVPREKLLLLEQWNSTSLVLSPALFQKAREIGATPAHELSGLDDYGEVPCQVQTLQGETLDKCLLTFRSSPPLEHFTNPPRLFTEIADIFPSDHALSFPIRFQSSRSKEDKPGRAPTYLVTPEGRPLQLNWTVNFIDRKGLVGRDLSLAPKGSPRPKGRVLSLGEPEDLTLFLGDWTRDSRQLFRQDIR